MDRKSNIKQYITFLGFVYLPHKKYNKIHAILKNV